MAQTTQKLQIIVDAENRTNAALGGVNKSLDKVQTKLKSMQPAFKKMAMDGTVAFAAVSAGAFEAIRAATNAQEIFNKFDVVFDDVGNSAEEVAQDLVDNFGLAESSAKDLLSATGDLLSGFGFTGEAALSLSERTQKLSIDLASFTNLQGGAARASGIITKALLGEKDSLVALGVKVLDADVNNRLLIEGKDKLVGLALRQAKAEATLQLIIEQSGKAIGDYARTSESAANQTRKLQERTKELSEKIGRVLLPIYEKVLEKIIPIIEKMAEWIDKNPELTRNIIIVTAAIAGLVTVVGLLGLALPFIITGFGLLLGPVGLIVAALAALAVAINFVRTNWNKLFNRAVEETKKEEIAIEKTTEAMKKLEVVGGGAMKKVSKEAANAAKEILKIEDSIKGLNEKLTELLVDRVKGDKALNEELAEAFIDQEEKVLKLKEEVEEKKKAVTDAMRDDATTSDINARNERVNNAKKELAEIEIILQQELTAFEEGKTIEIAFADEVEEVRRRNALTDFDRTKEDIELKRILFTQESDQKIADVNREIAKQNEKLEAVKKIDDEISANAIARSNESTSVAIDNQDSILANAKRVASQIASVNAKIFGGGNIFTNNPPAFFNRADGGSVQGGRTMLVGEHGPELFTPLTNGRINKGGSGGGVTVNVTVNGDVSGFELIEKVKRALMLDLKQNIKLS